MHRQRLLQHQQWQHQQTLYGIMGSLMLAWLGLWILSEQALAQPGEAAYSSLSNRFDVLAGLLFSSPFLLIKFSFLYKILYSCNVNLVSQLFFNLNARFDLLYLPTILVLVLIAPIGMVWWMRQRALRTNIQDLSCLWFHYFRHLSWITLTVWLTWIGLFLTIRVGKPFDLGFATEHILLREGLELVLFGAPPVAAIAVCYGLSHAVLVRLGSNSSKSNLVQRVVWGQLQGFLPFALFLSGCRLYFSNHFSLAVGLLGAACMSQVLLTRLVMQANDWVTQALTVGELRDRIFALAQPTGVNLKQVYVLPAARQGAVNAFAIRGGNVMLTDNLVRHLTKRELDAVMAHELAHLQYKHPQMLHAIRVVALLGTITGSAVLSIWVPGLVTVPLAILLSIVVYYAFSRRFEYQADLQATHLTQDPTAMITGLVKLAQISQIPMRWGKRTGLLMTHPSMQQRIETIARRHQLNISQLQQLAALDQGSEHYTLPETVAAQTLLFSTAFKQRMLWQTNVLVMLTMILPAGLMAVGVVHWVDNPVWQTLLQWAGFMITVGLLRILLSRTPLWGYQQLRQRLGQTLQQQGIQANAWDGMLVGLAPNCAARLYEGFEHWDLGFLFLKGNRLCYVGEHTRFALHTTQIRQITVERGQGWQLPQLGIAWQDGAFRRAFKLQVCDGTSLPQVRQRLCQLKHQIGYWQATSLEPILSEPIPLPLATLPPPQWGQITSQVVDRRTVGQQFVTTLAVLMVLMLGGCVLLHLPFGWQPGSWLYMVLVGLAAATMQFLPLWLSLSSATNPLLGTVQAPDLV